MSQKNEFGVCDDCSGVSLQEDCRGCGRKPPSMKCSDCGKRIGGGFRFEEGKRQGFRCFECLETDRHKKLGWSALELLQEYLEDGPERDGRRWKAYALELEKQLKRVRYTVDLYQKDKKDFIK